MSVEYATDELGTRLRFLGARAAAARVTPEAFDLDAILGDYGTALAALEAVLRLHAATGYRWSREPCARHRGGASWADSRECSDCRVIEYAACEICRDDEGNPARPEDCKVRQAVSQWMLGRATA